MPSKLAQQVLHTLLAARLVVEVAGAETAYAPARPLETINCHHILLAMRATHGQELITRDEPMRVEVLGEFARIQAAESEAAERRSRCWRWSIARRRELETWRGADRSLRARGSVAPGGSSKLTAVLE